MNHCNRQVKLMLKQLKDFFGGYQATGSIEYIIAGLGNPGKQYENTRHNAGFLAVDYIAGKLGIPMKRLKFQALCGDGLLAGRRVLFLKPSTFMNRSGESVRDAMSFYKVPVEKTIVLFDDASLPVGGMRIRRGGSDGGQKGMKSIIYLTGTDQFPRIKIGIGHKPHPEMDMADWVLQKFTGADLKNLAPLWPDVLDALEKMVSGDIEAAMNQYNIRGQGGEPG